MRDSRATQPSLSARNKACADTLTVVLRDPTRQITPTVPATKVDCCITFKLIQPRWIVHAALYQSASCPSPFTRSDSSTFIIVTIIIVISSSIIYGVTDTDIDRQAAIITVMQRQSRWRDVSAGTSPVSGALGMHIQSGSFYGCTVLRELGFLCFSD